MASLLENLPNEIMLHIFRYINPGDLDATQARLIKCSKALRRRFEPWLYSSQESCDRIVRLACIRGLNETIKLAVGTYNASPSTVTIWQRNGRGKPARPLKILTLHLATKKMKSDTFELLLKLGARVDVGDINSVVATSQISRILKALHIDHAKMLHPFFTSGTAGQVQHISVADHCLVPAIINKASVETVQLLLDHGASPNRLEAGDVRMNALSAAVKVGSINIFTLLLDRGADLNVKGALSRGRSIFEVPVLAAAQAMAEFQSTEMLQLCIDHGGSLDVNLRFQHRHSRTFMTVLLAYLDAIADWQVTFRLSPAQAVSFILHHLGHHESGYRHKEEANPGHDRLLIGQILEMLVRKWGVNYLEVDEFFHCRDHTEMGRILYQFVLYCEDTKYISKRENVEILVDRLIQSGADINFSPHEDISSYPVLHAVCNQIDKETRKMEEERLIFFGWQYEIDSRSWLLEMIVRKGGDATLRFNGLTALDRLRRTRHHHVETRIYISHLTGYLNYPGGVMDGLEDFVEFSGLFSDE
ncbi:unnamed protein product [Clonostachys solani]|uniref:F-box domain-containing protein n=1 Tax=Clonostachys solani TaxID=160281 RepID=A0A9P0EFG5_9HYPO|nr:unnamed protein product [Clonostachys solani]